LRVISGQPPFWSLSVESWDRGFSFCCGKFIKMLKAKHVILCSTCRSFWIHVFFFYSWNTRLFTWILCGYDFHTKKKKKKKKKEMNTSMRHPIIACTRQLLAMMTSALILLVSSLADYPWLDRLTKIKKIEFTVHLFAKLCVMLCFFWNLSFKIVFIYNLFKFILCKIISIS